MRKWEIRNWMNDLPIEICRLFWFISTDVSKKWVQRQRQHHRGCFTFQKIRFFSGTLSYTVIPSPVTMSVFRVNVMAQNLRVRVRSKEIVTFTQLNVYPFFTLRILRPSRPIRVYFSGRHMRMTGEGEKRRTKKHINMGRSTSNESTTEAVKFWKLNWVLRDSRVL